MNYPCRTKKNIQKQINYANRGMVLESELNETNNYYLVNNVAVIHKKPTPITIKKVDYISPQKVKIKDAYFQKPSTTDYNGIYKGRYIDFEAKETKNENYFPLKNIHAHQIEHLRKVIEHGGIGFIIVRFITYNETFYLDGKDLMIFIENNKRLSIPHSYFKDKGHLINIKYNPRLDYIKVIDKIYFKGEYYEKEIRKN
ncbi:MAG: Holliday junction resolvase RecU [Bacilli bacterium]|nr:Holliday junction resolvase RecU [Bacilli bacterium]MDD4282724.1 Holliday junction resolvase RecU [Bacilli bacterium]MDD4718394.1 Holliday junction resolvase RecU [Bacilli bacterium]